MVTLVTAVLELAAIGLLVFNKSQLDSLPDLMDTLMAQPMTEPELDVVIVDGSGGILTAAGDVPTPATRPGSSEEQGGGPGAGAVSGGGSGEVEGKRNGTEVGETFQGGDGKGTSPGDGGTTSTTVEIKKPTEVAHNTTEIPGNNATTSSMLSSTTSSPVSTNVSTSSASTRSSKSPEGRQSAGKSASRSAPPSPQTTTSHPVSFANNTSPPLPPTPTTTSAQSNISGTAAPTQSPRRRRHADQDREESGEDLEDHTEEVIIHWAPAATDCLLRPDQSNRTHCFTQLEHHLKVRKVGED